MIDRTRVVGGLLFATHRERAWYLGRSNIEQRRWLLENPGRWWRIEDLQQEDATRRSPVEGDVNVRVRPASNDRRSSPDIQNDSNGSDVTSVDAPAGDSSPPHEPTSLPTSKAEPLPPKIMRIVLNFLRERPILYLAALAAGIHPKTLAYWIRRSEAGDDGYDIKWQGLTQRFHEHCESAIDEAHQNLKDEWLRRAIDGYEKVLTNRGRVVYKIDQELVGLGLQGPDAYLRDENGKPVPETVHKEDTKAQLRVLKRHRPDTWGKRPKINAPREGSVLVIGDVTKKPKCNTAKSVRARKWKADSRRIREEKE